MLWHHLLQLDRPLLPRQRFSILRDPEENLLRKHDLHVTQGMLQRNIDLLQHVQSGRQLHRISHRGITTPRFEC